jgi:hypothetical protein
MLSVFMWLRGPYCRHITYVKNTKGRTSKAGKAAKLRGHIDTWTHGHIDTQTQSHRHTTTHQHINTDTISNPI